MSVYSVVSTLDSPVESLTVSFSVCGLVYNHQDKLAEIMASKEHVPSPGNGLFPDIPPMRAPHLEFVYRLVARMHPVDKYEMENIQGTGVTRSVGHIQGGEVRGPKINGTVIENSGADWAQRIHCKKVCRSIEIAQLC